jgi:hypothetical protein
MAVFIERETNGRIVRRGNRLIVRRFPDSHSAHGFLNKGGNGLDWQISTKGLPAGTYAYPGRRAPGNARRLSSALSRFMGRQIGDNRRTAGPARASSQAKGNGVKCHGF